MSWYERVLIRGRIVRVTSAPDFNSPLEQQEYGLPDDLGAELFGPGEPIPSLFSFTGKRALECWGAMLPELAPHQRFLARWRATQQTFDVLDLPALRRRPDATPHTNHDLVRAAREEGVPGVLLSAGADLQGLGLALVTHRLAREHIHAERRSLPLEFRARRLALEITPSI